jgi:hypothetical protein
MESIRAGLSSRKRSKPTSDPPPICRSWTSKVSIVTKSPAISTFTSVNWPGATTTLASTTRVYCSFEKTSVYVPGGISGKT